MSELRLKVTTGETAGAELSVTDELVFGREAPGEGRLADDLEVSRQHARITRTPQDEWAIEDLGSRNGTYVNGHRITGSELLAPGDAIELGGTRLVVQVSAPPAAAPGQPDDASLGATVVGSAPPAGVPGSGPQPDAPEATAPPTEPVEPQPAEPAEPEPDRAAPEVPPVSLTVEVDLAAAEARVSLGEGSDTVELVFEDGAWRIRPGA